MEKNKKNKEKRELHRELILEKEPQANLLLAKIQCGIGLGLLGVFVLFLCHVYSASRVLTVIALCGSAAVLFLTAGIVFLLKGKKRFLKYMLLISYVIVVHAIVVLSGFKVMMCLALPILFSCRYYNKKLTVTIGVISALALLSCTHLNALVSPDYGIMDLNMVRFQNPVELQVTDWLYAPVIEAGLDRKTVFWDTFRLSFMPNLLIIALCIFVSLFLITYSQNLMVEIKEETRQKDALEQEVYNTKSRIMMSQITPHFLYNTLTAIMAIDGNPPETVDALEDFSKYLRENINILSAKDLIPFEDEINHVHRYVSLEKLRFRNRVNVSWNLEKRNFLIPPLSIQMLVENAIKHGITQKVEGGTVKISSFMKNDRIIIVIEDDGVGFTDVHSPRPGHIGLENVKMRISTLCNGETNIESTVGRGTKITISLPPQGGTYENNNS